MKPRAARLAFALWAAVAASGAAAEDPASGCRMRGAPGDAIMDRKGTLSRYQQLPEHCLKSVFMRCAAAANERLLDFGDAAVCSVAYEALLIRGFGGNFQAMLVWWRRERERGVAN